ncbi:MAG: RES family NAD+ phosphorylase [Dissulfurispiraceae bacterium]
MVTAYRMCQKMWALEAFSGEGAKKRGMRWNHKDIPVIYVAEHLSLSALEIIVNFPRKTLGVPFVFFKVEIPETVKIANVGHLPMDWRDLPYQTSTQDIGSQWALERKTAVLEVPSAVIPIERNYILNPLHPDFTKILINPATDFHFDNRLL